MKCVLHATVSVGHALAITEELAEYVAMPHAPAAILYVAETAERGLVLGQYQHGAFSIDGDAVAEDNIAVHRRLTGGPAAWFGPGVVYASLVLRHASILMECPPDKILNRNVRGFLGGLSLAGAPAHYFGREWISVDRRPAALIGWNRTASGAVVLECFLALDKPFVPAPRYLRASDRVSPPFLGKDPLTLTEAWGQTPDVRTLFTWLMEGHALRYPGTTAAEIPLPQEVGERAKLRMNERRGGALPAENGMAWSAPREIPIGVLEAGLTINAKGLVEDARLAGDFFQDAGAAAALRERLVGHAPSPTRLMNALNQTYDGKVHVIEGVKDLNPALDALLEVAETAPNSDAAHEN